MIKTLVMQNEKGEPLMELVYGAIGRISALAAGRELAAIKGRK